MDQNIQILTITPMQYQYLSLLSLPTISKKAPLLLAFSHGVNSLHFVPGDHFFLRHCGLHFYFCILYSSGSSGDAQQPLHVFWYTHWLLWCLQGKNEMSTHIILTILKDILIWFLSLNALATSLWWQESTQLLQWLSYIHKKYQHVTAWSLGLLVGVFLNNQVSYFRAQFQRGFSKNFEFL